MIVDIFENAGKYDSVHGKLAIGIELVRRLM